MNRSSHTKFTLSDPFVLCQELKMMISQVDEEQYDAQQNPAEDKAKAVRMAITNGQYIVAIS